MNLFSNWRVKLPFVNYSILGKKTKRFLTKKDYYYCCYRTSHENELKGSSAYEINVYPRGIKFRRLYGVLEKVAFVSD